MYEIYNIKEGDNLTVVASKFDTTEDELIKINGIKLEEREEPLQQIIVPSLKNNTFNYYTVKKGDTIYKIAEAYNIDYNVLLKINGLEKDDYIYPNQTLLLPRNNKNIYITKENDTLNSIIKELNTNIDNITNKNNDIYLKEEQLLFF